MDDLISRQAAIDDLHKHLMYRMGTDSNKKRLDDWINNLPSVQPEIIHCRDCKHHFYERSSGIPYCNRIDYGYGWKDNDFCSRAERRND